MILHVNDKMSLGFLAKILMKSAEVEPFPCTSPKGVAGGGKETKGAVEDDLVGEVKFLKNLL